MSFLEQNIEKAHLLCCAQDRYSLLVHSLNRLTNNNYTNSAELGTSIWDFLNVRVLTKPLMIGSIDTKEVTTQVGITLMPPIR